VLMILRTTSYIISELFTLTGLFRFEVHDLQLFTFCVLLVLQSGMGGNCYRNVNKFSDPVGNGNEIWIK